MDDVVAGAEGIAARGVSGGSPSSSDVLGGGSRSSSNVLAKHILTF